VPGYFRLVPPGEANFGLVAPGEANFGLVAPGEANFCLVSPGQPQLPATVGFHKERDEEAYGASEDSDAVPGLRHEIG